MQFTIDDRQLFQQTAFQQTAGTSGAFHPWNLGLIALEDTQPAKPELEPNSFTSACECPDACLRDHENE